MQVFWLVVLILAAMPVHAASPVESHQDTHSWCSPAVKGGRSEVYVTCQGVSSEAADRLNELLDERGLGREEKLRRAEQWAWKYLELKQILSAEGQDNESARQAVTQLEAGDLEAVGKFVDQPPAPDAETNDRLASHHYKRAHVYALQFKPLQALPHYEKAYGYRPDHSLYAHGYAMLLQEQNRYAAALDIYQENLTNLRKQAESDPATYLPYVARTLHNLTEIYRAIRRPEASEQALQEALHTYQRLAETTPATYLPYVARTLHSLAGLYRTTRQLGASEQALQDALQIYRRLAEAHASVYQAEVAGTLNNLGLLYGATRRPEASEQALQDALQIYRRLAEANSPAYLPEVARTLNNLAGLYRTTRRLGASEQALQDVLQIYRRLAEANPAEHLPELAGTLNNLGLLYSATSRPRESEQTLQEALQTYRRLAEVNASAYLPEVAGTLNNLALLSLQQEDLQQADQLLHEALTIRRRLWNRNPTAYGDALAQSLALEVALLERSHAPAPSLCRRLQEMQDVALSARLQQWARDKDSALCSKGRETN